MILLPTIAPEVPAIMIAGTGNQYLSTLAEGLARADVLELPSPLPDSCATSARLIVLEGLTPWWERITAPLKLFKLSLRLSESLWSDRQYAEAPSVWAILERPDSTNYPPAFTLSKGVLALEKECEGFGQTAMAVLQDALNWLPYCVYPSMVEGLVSWAYWWGENDETEHLNEALSNVESKEIEGMTLEQALDYMREQTGIVTRKFFDQSIPPWVANAKRVRSRESIHGAIKSQWARRVFYALDLLAEAAQATPMLKHEMSYSDGFGTDVALFLRWTVNDISAQAFDDIANEAFNAGENHEILLAEPVPLKPAKLRRWKAGLEHLIAVAAATETLIELIGDPI